MARSSTSKRKSSREDLDAYIGGRIKSRRSFLGISQDKLGSYLGVTFQQVQKYEKGTNRVSASMLYDVARILSVDVTYFYEGFRGEQTLNDDEDPVYIGGGVLNEKETAELLRSYYGISIPSVRKKFSELMKTLAGSELKD
ncbi:MAG: helix-turn-helix domain-containing protein [Holosporaceae bacterium]|nr:helix-turn-helix domain-containing protein [Holosporaceae bacterium]